MSKYTVLPSNVEIEVTEGVLVKNVEVLRHCLNRLHDMGFRIAIDDFGTGYASLIVLCDIPVDILKIDFQLTQNFVKYPQHRTILKLVSDFCKKGTIRLCAEGVETENSLSVMKDAGAELIQGFLISRPIPAEEFKKKFVEKVKVN